MAVKKFLKEIKLQIPAGKATPAPPIGPALGAAGVNIMSFCQQYNAATQKQEGSVLPVIITVYTDKSFTFITKEEPAAEKIRKAAGVEKGSGVPNRQKVGQLPLSKALELARQKAQDMNAHSEEGALRMIKGTARSMGIDIVEG